MLPTKKLKRSRGSRSSISIMNLDQLIFTSTGRHLVVALLASILYAPYKFQKSLQNNLIDQGVTSAIM